MSCKYRRQAGTRHGRLWTSGDMYSMIYCFVSVVDSVARQITEMAADVVECCALARRVALRLAGALTVDSHPEPNSPDDLSCLSFGKDIRSAIERVRRSRPSWHGMCVNVRRSVCTEKLEGRGTAPIDRAHAQVSQT